jgi:hypothetical protein
LLLMGASLAPLLAAALLAGSPASSNGQSCNEQGTHELVVEFIGAFNRGDLARLDRLFARGMWWRWYAVGTAPGKRIQAAAYNRNTLVTYFRARHKKHERLQLRSFQYTGRSDGYAHFQYEILRRADDMAKGAARTYTGKGAMSCWEGRLAVWGMGES